MSSDLDHLMSIDPLELSNTDLDKIIEYHRNQRARKASGEKIQKPTAHKIDLSEIAQKLAPKPDIKMIRRI